LRRTFPELEASLLHYFRRDVPRSSYVAFHESKHLVEWPNGSTTRFGYFASEHDVYQYQGAEYLFIGIDELTLFTLRQWQFLTSHNRCAVPGTFPCMAGATNLGNIGHAWVKALWIDKQPAAGMERPEEYDVKDYDFIPARFFDNPIYAADRSYQKTLQALPSNLKRALFDGDWDVFAGQYFDRCDLARNTARAEEIEWQPWWPRWISIDWGFEHPAATYWHAQAPASLSTAADAKNENFGANGEACGQPNSCVVTYREYVTHRTSPCAAWVVRSERRQTAFIPGRRLCRFRKTGGKRSARFIFHRMRLPVVPTTLRWRNRWEMCSRRQAFRGPHRRMTIASTGKRCNRSRAGLDLCRARRAGIPSAQVTRSGRDSLHCDRPSWAGADGWECGTSGDACVCRSSRSGWLSA
jgi:hypothetical protein